MAVQVFDGLTGSGYQAFEGGGLTPIYERVAVTNVGSAVPVGGAVATRYLHLGLWALYEDNPNPEDEPSGLYLSQFHFLTYERESWNDRTAVDAQGYSGFYYELALGVVATFWFGTA